MTVPDTIVTLLMDLEKRGLITVHYEKIRDRIQNKTKTIPLEVPA